jgi:hypothetical protein
LSAAIAASFAARASGGIPPASHAATAERAIPKSAIKEALMGKNLYARKFVLRPFIIGLENELKSFFSSFSL